ncbi:MAG: hypothetical protein WCI05_03770 [Myxococcales bacterium]
MTAESLFLSYFWPLYPPNARDLVRARSEDAGPNASYLGHLEGAAAVFAKMLGGGKNGLDFTDASVHRLSALLTPEQRARWALNGEAGTAQNELFNVVVHGAAYVGACIVRNHGGSWSLRRPLWESVVHLSSRAGEADLAVFHWWLKSLADDAGGHGLADRYRTLVEVPCACFEELVRIAPGDRRLPRLGKARYDQFQRHLRAHLPELRDLGADFPSAERFEAYDFEWLEAKLVGDGRMLLLYGPGSGGAHLFWLDHTGFQKSLFFPCDHFPDPVVKLVDGRIQLFVSVDEKVVRHEMLWWGP